MASDNQWPSKPSAGSGPTQATGRACAFAVHLLTASGAALALLALIAASQAQWTLMFVWLGIALIVDAIDGPMARRFDVVATLPRWSGDVLDLVVDYLTYVFIPAYALAMSGLLPAGLAIPLGVVIAVTGAIYFADREMKFADNFFRGFPTLWNVVLFYLFLLKLPPASAALIIILCSVWTFLPSKFVHPLRVRHWRTVTLAAVGMWTALAIASVAYRLDPPQWIQIGLICVGAYVIAVGLIQGTMSRR